jgi:soluble lytic murein transglycosylase-like protein
MKRYGLAFLAPFLALVVVVLIAGGAAPTAAASRVVRAAKQQETSAAKAAAAWKRGLVRRDEHGRIVLDTSPAAMAVVQEQERKAAEAARRRVVVGRCVKADGKAGRTLAAPADIRQAVEAMAPLHSLDPRLVLAVIAVESNFHTKATSPKNAQGLMQLIPETQARFGVTDPYDRDQNLRGGMRYLKWLIEYFKGDLARALAGYNAGEKSVDRHGGIPPYAETVAYVAKVRELYGCEKIPVDAAATGEPSPGTVDRSARAPSRPPAAAATSLQAAWTGGCPPAGVATGRAPGGVAAASPRTPADCR